MQFARIFAIGSFAAVACGVEAVDFSDKTCPCPSDLVCDTATNHCIAEGTSSNTPACTPKSCDDMKVECGPTNDGCGGFLDCGACAVADNVCVQNKCVCQPKDCKAQGADCGQVPSGCGQTFQCDVCPSATPNCGGNGPNKCGTAKCTPRTCQAGIDCGLISDGCGQTLLDCGSCASPSVCGGNGTANKCGCTAKTCAQLGWQCGNGTDNCGQPKTCGTCADSGKACVNHACVCGTCSTLGWQCGSGPNGCGGTIDCGGCSVGTCRSTHKCDD